MADPKATLEDKVEMALLAVLSDAGLEDHALLLAGHEFEDREGPSVSVTCWGGPEIVFGTGNYMKRVRIVIKTAADREEGETTLDDPRESHRNLVQLVREAIFTESIAEDLTEQEADFTANILIPGDPEAGVEGRQFFTNLNLELDCVRADFE